jgi:hypothetical protein
MIEHLRHDGCAVVGFDARAPVAHLIVSSSIECIVISRQCGDSWLVDQSLQRLEVAKWPSGHVGWNPANVEMPAALQVSARNDTQ